MVSSPARIVSSPSPDEIITKNRGTTARCQRPTLAQWPSTGRSLAGIAGGHYRRYLGSDGRSVVTKRPYSRQVVFGRAGHQRPGQKQDNCEDIAEDSHAASPSTICR